MVLFASKSNTWPPHKWCDWRGDLHCGATMAGWFSPSICVREIPKVHFRITSFWDRDWYGLTCSWDPCFDIFLTSTAVFLNIEFVFPFDTFVPFPNFHIFANIPLKIISFLWKTNLFFSYENFELELHILIYIYF